MTSHFGVEKKLGGDWKLFVDTPFHQGFDEISLPRKGHFVKVPMHTKKKKALEGLAWFSHKIDPGLEPAEVKRKPMTAQGVVSIINVSIIFRA